MLEVRDRRFRASWHDTREHEWDDNGGAGSTHASVAHQVGNPQQVYVQSVDVKEFYNQANDMQPSRVSPLPGLRNTQPAVLKPDYMWAYRWPDAGPYKGMTAKPFSWERASMDGFNEVTSGQRERVAALTSSLRELNEAIASMRRDTSDDESLLHISLLQNSAADITGLMRSVDTLQDTELDMLLDDVAFELEQLQERVEVLAIAIPGTAAVKTGLWILGGVALAGAAFLIWRNRSG